MNYDDVDDLKAAFAQGDIERDDAIEVLVQDFGMSEDDATILIDTWPVDEDAADA